MSADDNGRKQLEPVAWLLGRQLIASLKWILLYTAFGTKLDARDWMQAKVYPADDQAKADEWWRNLQLARRNGEEPDESSDPNSGTEFWRGKEFWFDYLSDTGDGTKATYSIAYLCLSNLWMKKRWEATPDPREAAIQLEHLKREGDEYPEPLPRGEFLLVGGDTSYHLSDYETLHLRFHKPINWAYADLAADMESAKLPFESKEVRAVGRNLRPLFGIPGNHDYYDMLDGFRRQFRTPVATRPEDKIYPEGDLSGPQLKLDAFRKQQDTSYIALRMPFGWMLWGLDTEVGTIDERQRDFFLSTNGGVTPDKLIVATSAPTTVFGKGADREDKKSSLAFYQLKLARPFVKEALREKNEPSLSPNQIRLDIAGDVHQYARYWGPANKSTTTRSNAEAEASSATNYASVVSGLGGAFHHPSTTYVDEIKEQALYPEEAVSRRAVAEEIFNPYQVFRGGGVGVIGAVIALILVFTAIANDSSRPAIHNFPPFVYLGLTQPEHYESTLETAGEQGNEAMPPASPQSQAFRPANATPVQSRPKVTPFQLWQQLGVTGETWEPVIKSDSGALSDSSKCSSHKLLYLWGECAVKLPIDYMIGLVLLCFTLVVVTLTFLITEKIYAIGRKQEEIRHGGAKVQGWFKSLAKWPAESLQKLVLLVLWPTLALNVALGIIGVLTIIPYRPFITPFGNSLWVFLTLIWAVSSIVFSLRYSDWLFLQSSRITVGHSDWFITWALAIATLASLAVGLWLFGKNNLPAYLVADIIFVTVLLASFAGLIYVAVTMGGQHQKPLGKVGMVFVGVWHWILQLGVPLLLLKKGTWLTVALSVLAFFGFMFFGKMFMIKNYKWRLTAAWLAYGATMLALPPLVFYWLAGWGDNYAELRSALFWPHPFGPQSSFASYEWWGTFGGFWQLVPLSLACLFGLVFSCIWVGWYFAVCLRFNGHNNEAGGAARIENYKQFIRFRLRENDLTGYVIAVDKPVSKGSLLRQDPQNVRIVDVFHLKRADIETPPPAIAEG